MPSVLYSFTCVTITVDMTCGHISETDPSFVRCCAVFQSAKGEKTTLNSSQTEGGVEDLNADDTFGLLRNLLFPCNVLDTRCKSFLVPVTK